MVNESTRYQIRNASDAELLALRKKLKAKPMDEISADETEEIRLIEIELFKVRGVKNPDVAAA